MKIKRIKIENNSILGSIDLDFTNSNWEIYDNIVFVWENWSWKSTLLNIVYQTGQRQALDLNEWEKREIFLEVDDEIIIPHDKIEPWEYKVIIDEAYINQNYLNSDNKFYKHLRVFWNTEQDIARKFLLIDNQIFKTMFSDTSINFNSKIDRTTNISIDEEVKLSKKSDENIAQNIAQALVDIDQLDAQELKKWVKEHRIWNSFDSEIGPEIDKRWNRFRMAFNIMFNESWLDYEWTENLQPSFKKNGIIIPINYLSSWEKQVVFRWSFFLKDKNSIKWYLWIIDEPEISMHPKRQIKILDYYKNIFEDEHWNQTSQLFISTHSPYVLRWLNKDTDCIFIFPWWKKVDNIRHYLWDTPSLSVINYVAYDLPSNELHNELYAYIQVKSNNYREEDLDVYLSSNGFPLNKQRTWESNWVVWNTYDVTLQTFIRNKIHHPENQSMQSVTFNDNDLKESIYKMIEFINNQGW